ncbi:Hypothetical predicted protein [Olea europaea subsp. europaea]|uniref:Uncharacterized protein n=1 Tax=Olea europaea subsp. europaea TaxID=158383 RepID=A0A8S0SGL2_OLEEU|nr:Hypothetical predicted protein [Olea europaea subsp. europaea]
MSPEWAIGRRALTLIQPVCYELNKTCEIAYLKDSNHPHPAAVTAQYLVANTCAPETRINVTVTKKGRQFTNLTADMIQHVSIHGLPLNLLICKNQGKITISAQLIFTSMPAVSLPADPKLSLLPSSSQSRYIPTFATPSSLSPTPLGSKLSPFKVNMSWSEDPTFISSNKAKATHPSTLHEGGLEWGAYLDLFGEKEWKGSMLGFAGDLFKNAPELMAGQEGEWWYPTMNLHLQYFSRFVLYVDKGCV